MRRRDAARITSLQSQLAVERERVGRLEVQLRNLADHDPVTDLLNHRSVVHALEDHLAGCSRYGPEGAFLLVRLEGLAEITRALGQTEADAALASLAEVVAETMRATDIVGRWAADELAVLLPRAVVDEVTAVAGSLMRLVAETGTARVPAGSLTASIGLTAVSASPTDPTHLVAAARKAMAVARARGGGWVAADIEALPG